MTKKGLYIHFPFCARKCPYCDFYSVSSLELIPAWVDALAKEVRHYAPLWAGQFDTVYVGGGSPSLLSGAGLKRLKEALSPLDLTDLCEFTLEANPEDVTEEGARHWQEFGLSRISLGCQSFDDRWLSTSLLRTHSAAQNVRAAEIIKEAKFDLSLDLIYGHPSQETQDWGSDLAAALKLQPAHISTYGLTVVPGTALAKSIADRLSPPPPPAEMQAEMFLISRQALAPYGYVRYEVSNFALAGHECQHNLKYWRTEAYLGLGPAAHSFDGQKRWANVSSLRRWLAAWERQEPALAFSEVIDEKAARLEKIMLGLRLAEGLPLALLENSPKLGGFIQSGHLYEDGGRIKPTEKGFLIADRLALELS